MFLYFNTLPKKQWKISLGCNRKGLILTPNMRHLILIAITCLVASSVVMGQVLEEPSDWRKETGRESDFYSRFDFRRYSIKDVENAKSKYLSIVSKVTRDEWSGTYTRGTMLGYSELVWNETDGFVYAYTYHTLGHLDYGRVKFAGNSISFISQKAVHLTQSNFEEYVRVRFGERHLLVGKRKLADFAKLAVGREVAASRDTEAEGSFFWEMVGEEEKSIGETPEFPAEFQQLVLKPLTTTLVSVGKMRVKKEISKQWGTTSIDHLVDLRLSIGSGNGVRRGMRFWIDELEEWVDIVSVSKNWSLALLSRAVIDGKEHCDRFVDGNYSVFPCRTATPGMNARTRSNYF